MVVYSQLSSSCLHLRLEGLTGSGSLLLLHVLTLRDELLEGDCWQGRWLPRRVQRDLQLKPGSDAGLCLSPGTHRRRAICGS